MGDSDPPFSVDCTCGQRIPVAAGKAGTTLICRCGKPVQVPKLAELRVQAGQDRYATNSVERARRIVEDGKWQLDHCLACGGKADKLLRPTLVSARAYARNPGPDKQEMLLRMFGIIGALATLFESSRDRVEESASRGHDLTLTVPLSICNSCDPSRHWTKRRSVRTILERIPEFSAIFREFPETTIEF
jgi:hypothetical protein